ncbi:MAG: hypothetical protein F6K42_27795 [Leptolyngbya sp. SIO1D8]|nr:hypothetical protein [Leptolyngbya sp. SIO1D8]
MRSCNASPTPLARFGNKTTDISAFEITAKGALEAEPDRALQERAIIARRLESPAVRAQLETMVQRLAAEPAVQAFFACREKARGIGSGDCNSVSGFIAYHRSLLSTYT